MLAVEFTEAQVAQLSYERFHHPHPRVQRKMEAILLKAKGFSLRDICEVVGCCPNTFRSWLRDFASGGVEGLKRWDSGGTTSELDRHVDAVCEYFTEHPPHTIAEAREAIERLTGVRRSNTQISQFLKRLGFRRVKTGALPAKADPAVQDAFKKTSLSPA